MRNIDYAMEEGIMIALITCWMEKTYFLSQVEEFGKTVGVHAFVDFHDNEIGRVIIDKYEFYDNFCKFIARENFSHFFSLCVRFRSKDYFEQALCTEIGKTLKKSSWWQNNFKEIKENQSNFKKVRKVMMA